MGKAAVGGAEIVVTAILEPKIDEQGLLNVPITRVRLGTLSITLLAKALAAREYERNISPEEYDSEILEMQIANSLLHSQPFGPIFEVESQKVCVQKVAVSQQKLALRLALVSD